MQRRFSWIFGYAFGVRERYYEATFEHVRLSQLFVLLVGRSVFNGVSSDRLINCSLYDRGDWHSSRTFRQEALLLHRHLKKRHYGLKLTHWRSRARAPDRLLQCKRIYVVRSNYKRESCGESEQRVECTSPWEWIANREQKRGGVFSRRESHGIGVLPIEDERKKVGETCRGCWKANRRAVISLTLSWIVECINRPQMTRIVAWTKRRKRRWRRTSTLDTFRI